MRRTAIPFNVQLASDWTFFGLTATYKLVKEDQCFDLAFHGKGGFTYDDARNLPVYLRTYFINKINDYYKERNKADEKAVRQTQSKSRARPPSFRR